MRSGETDLESGRVERLSAETRKPAYSLIVTGCINVEIDGVSARRASTPAGWGGRGGAHANQAGFPVICVTNQPAVAKGYHNVLRVLNAVYAGA